MVNKDRRNRQSFRLQFQICALYVLGMHGLGKLYIASLANNAGLQDMLLDIMHGFFAQNT